MGEKKKIKISVGDGDNIATINDDLTVSVPLYPDEAKKPAKKAKAPVRKRPPKTRKAKTERHEKNSGEPANIIIKKADEQVDHPAHYGGDDNPYETIEVIKNVFGSEACKSFCVANAYKYISRAGKKNPEKEKEDIHKAIWYLQYTVDNILKD